MKLNGYVVMNVLLGITNIVWGWKKVTILMNTFVKPVNILRKVNVNIHTILNYNIIIVIYSYVLAEATKSALSSTKSKLLLVLFVYSLLG